MSHGLGEMGCMGWERDEIGTTRKWLGGLGCEEGYSKSAQTRTTRRTSTSVLLTF